MIDNELKKIFSGHIDDWCRDQEGEKTFEDYVLSAMREAVQKGSIEFAEWHKDKYHWNWHYKKWTLGMITDKELIEKIGLTTEQLYQEYKKLNP